MKIIASDYDGTLNHKGIDDVKRNAISKWRKAGNMFGIVSGRGYLSLLYVIEKENFEYVFLLCCNGAVVCDKKGNVLKESRCDGALAKPFIEDLFSWGCPFANIEKDTPVMVRALKSDCEDDEFTFSTMPEITYFNQISTMLETVEEASKIVDKINDKYKDSLNPLQNGTCIDIVPSGMDKAKGIYALLGVLGAEYGDVIAVGDNINDAAMIEEFRSYAMENGVESIKRAANYITSGITELIEKEI